jgi:glycosyltransferase involved in cell wall biosynthesis
MKVLILPDGLNWIVDRNCDALVKHLPEIEFMVFPYTRITVKEFSDIANHYDLIHYFNWDIYHLKDALPHIKKPFLMSVRSHRYHDFTHEMYKRPNTWFHVINPDLLKDFPNATYIPNGIFDQFKPDHEFTVGFAGHPDYHAKNYKGVHLIEQACRELGVAFKPALGEIDPMDMPEYYKSIDLYVCASEGEGFSTPVMECLAMNKPVISVDTGLPRKMVQFTVDRSVDGIKQGILKFYTQGVADEYKWPKVAQQYKQFYERVLNQK